MDSFAQDTKAPFNMAIATLLSLRDTLNMIRNIEGRIDYPPSERQRIKIELVKRFYVDSSPLIQNETIIEKFKWILDLEPQEIIKVDKSSLKQKRRISYSSELNRKMDYALIQLQLQLQKKKYFMPPSDDMASIGAKMS
jgi:hypothetical protein